jgi:hypothetical protein
VSLCIDIKIGVEAFGNLEVCVPLKILRRNTSYTYNDLRPYMAKRGGGQFWHKSGPKCAFYTRKGGKVDLNKTENPSSPYLRALY